MLIPDGSSEYELIVKRSRFLARAHFIDSLNAARETVKRLKDEQSDATHVVHACVVGPSGDLFSVSDDREPSGTAGRPALEVLRGRGITDVLLTVTRWFGGTKLGTGGLVKAYGDAAKGVLETLPLRELENRIGFTVRLPYRFYEQAVRLLGESGGTVTGSDFGVDVVMHGTVGEASVDSWETEVKELTSGMAQMEWET